MPRASFVRLFAAFIVAGMLTTWIGPLVPHLQPAWGLDDAAVGSLFLIQFLASMVVSVISGAVIQRVGRERTIALGYLAGGIAMVVLAWHGAPLHLPASALVGVAIGLCIPASNLAAADGERRTAHLALLNVAWASGAALWPLCVAATAEAGAPVALGVLAGLSLIAAALSAQSRHTDAAVASAAATPGRPAGAIPWGAFVRFAAMMFLYSGAEQSVGGWTAAWVAHDVPDAAALGATATSAYWVALSCGRFLVASMVSRVGERALVAASLALALTGVGMLLLAPPGRASIVAVAVAGLGLAAVFPVTLSAATTAFRGWGVHLTGPLLAVAGAGGAIVPWLVGLTAARWSLAAGFGVVVAALLALALLCAGMTAPRAVAPSPPPPS